jgi:3'-phosphoadenosine 5'-phosphosulfate sulfotransferase (PAPS reductase)/FAD synthetase
MAFWTEADVWEYLNLFAVPYSTIYDMGYVRTGCMFCMFGVHLEHKQRGGVNRFIQMKLTHPQQWKFCMDKLGLRKVLDLIGVPCE